MKIITFDLNQNKQLSKDKQRVIALGKFKTFHKGHQLVFLNAKKIAEKTNKELIFMMYPDFDGFKDKFVKSFIPYETRKRLIKQYNPNYILEFEPNPKNYRVTREEFISYLKETLNVTDVVVGDNFNFGKKKTDDFEKLKENFNLKVIPLLKIDHQIVSSTLIYNLLTIDGNMEMIKKVVGFNYFYEGNIAFGHQLGTKHGTPTINVVPFKDTQPPLQGIYFSKVYLEGKIYNSVTSISNNPTFKDRKFSWESHLFDFNQGVYRKFARVELLHFYRLPIKFSSIESLYEQIDKDKQEALKYFKQK